MISIRTQRAKTFLLSAANFHINRTHSFRDTRTRISLNTFELFINPIVHHDTFEATFNAPGYEVCLDDEGGGCEGFRCGGS